MRVITDARVRDAMAALGYGADPNRWPAYAWRPIPPIDVVLAVAEHLGEPEYTAGIAANLAEQMCATEQQRRLAVKPRG